MSTKIEWASESWNPVTGCSPISEGCAHCYAKKMAQRLRGRFGYDEREPFKITWHHDKINFPFHWDKPRMIFVCSMGDLFHKDVPDNWIADVLWVTARAVSHTFIFLTKRPERMREWFTTYRQMWDYDVTTEPHPWLWLGVTTENQHHADERIPVLLNIPAAIHFVSVEPMLDTIILRFPWLYEGRAARHPVLDWLICGAETGPGKRSMDPRWAANLRDQCTMAGVPFFFKKDSDGSRLLDGQKWEQVPSIQQTMLGV